MKTQFVLLFLFLQLIIYPQVINGRFESSINGNVYEVTIFANLTSGTGSAGVISLEFTYNTNAIGFSTNPILGVDYILLDTLANYIISNISRPQANRVRLNLLTINAPLPIELTNTSTALINLYFTILDQNQSSNLVWTQTNIAPTFLQSSYDVGEWPNLDEFPLPVELSSFNAKSTRDDVIELEWVTQTEVNNFGFEVERKLKDKQWGKIGFVKGNGNSNSPKVYSFKDTRPVGGNVFLYRLKQLDNDGHFSYSAEIEVELSLTEYKLAQNYPNPFNPSTKIEYHVMQDGLVTIKIYNLLGEEVETLVNEIKSAGIYEVNFNASNLASGIYFYDLKSGNFNQTKKLMLIK